MIYEESIKLTKNMIAILHKQADENKAGGSYNLILEKIIEQQDLLISLLSGAPKAQTDDAYSEATYH